ncbi:MAG: polyribonucleotide nucleotidyltransferase [Patescibacteria group bacterium]
MIKKKEFDIKSYEIDFAGKKLVLETGKLAEFADGSVTAICNDTVVLATVVVADEPKDGADFFPLLVDFEERFYAAGKISGSRFIKREGRPSDAAVLAARKIDRPLRPLFPKSYRNDIQVVITVLSYDGSVDPDILAIIASSAALQQTKAPFAGPIGALQVGIVHGEFVFNPTDAELEQSDLNLSLAATSDRVMMLEVESKEVPEEKIIAAIEQSLAKIAPQIDVQNRIRADHVTEEAAETPAEVILDQVHADVSALISEKIKTAMTEMEKSAREEMLRQFEEQVLSQLEGTYKQVDIKGAFAKIVEKEVRNLILDKGIRPDGRTTDEIRPLSIEVGLLPRTHGSALFTRGQTQALTVATLASPGMEQFIDTMEGESTKRFMHHYNFPPFSTGEVKPLRGAGRREIGHGYLAEKALKPVIPSQDEFPYTIRLVSEILSSNGSSSMAATCGGTLALMDAGVPIKKPITGIAMGLVANGDASQYRILTDLQGIEDFAGDMDFKVAGTKDGVTAVQMDTKITGLTMTIIRETFAQAHAGRMEILAAMQAVISQPREEISQFAPKIEVIKINPDKIGELIGPGGKNIKKIVDASGGREVISIDIEDDGSVMISSIDPKQAEKAISTIKAMTREIVPGETITGEVIEIKRDRMTGKEIGAIVAITPRIDGMVHISQISKQRVERVSQVLKVGDVVTAKVVDVDPEKGRISLSMKDA